MKTFARAEKYLIGFGLALVMLTGSQFVPVATAADPRFDDAWSAIEKAVALLLAADVGPDHQKCDKHRLKAVVLLLKAQEEIEEAKACVDAP
ncbi:MAG: hypothetical protein HZA91_20920 [Verrucomicrobia bacterium]|nr:hypothetical protein [Verrucomicrobiota bacterium]